MDAEEFEKEFGGDNAVPELDTPVFAWGEDDTGQDRTESQGITQDGIVKYVGVVHTRRVIYVGPGGMVIVEAGETLTFPETAFLLTPPEHRDLEDI